MKRVVLFLILAAAAIVHAEQVEAYYGEKLQCRSVEIVKDNPSIWNEFGRFVEKGFRSAWICSDQYGPSRYVIASPVVRDAKGICRYRKQEIYRIASDGKVFWYDQPFDGFPPDGSELATYAALMNGDCPGAMDSRYIEIGPGIGEAQLYVLLAFAKGLAQSNDAILFDPASGQSSPASEEEFLAAMRNSREAGMLRIERVTADACGYWVRLSTAGIFAGWSLCGKIENGRFAISSFGQWFT